MAETNTKATPSEIEELKVLSDKLPPTYIEVQKVIKISPSDYKKILVTAFLLMCCFRLNQKVVSLQGQVESDKVKIEYMENQVRIYEYTLDSLGVKY